MCKLFFSLNNANYINNLKQFLEQTFTPPISTDGFGISWFENNKWRFYKNQNSYNNDMIVNNVISNIDSMCIIAHIRHICPQCANISYNNTHPFVHNNNIFIHNGVIEDFDKNKILKYIDNKYIDYIEGNTDSEYIFYLLLTLKDKYKHKLIMKNLFIILKKISKKFYANIMFADKKYIIITRYAWGGEPIKLYYNKNNNGVLITTEPLTKKYNMIPVNKVLLYKFNYFDNH